MITKKSNNCITGVLGKKEKEYEAEKNIWIKMTENIFFNSINPKVGMKRWKRGQGTDGTNRKELTTW